MRRVWIVLLAGCGFQVGPTETTDALVPDVAGSDKPAALCWSVAYGSLNNATVCPIALGQSITISGRTEVDTTSRTTTLDGVSCAELAPGSPNVCALAATSITIAAGGTLLGHGDRPLVLLGHSIDVQGTIDVASHYGGQQGAGSDITGCQIGTRATGTGGGQGGTFSSDNGGKGGNGENGGDRGGAVIDTTGIGKFRGGCPGGPSSGGSSMVGGHGGGGVWLGVDGDGSLTVGDAAVINASGAGGAPGTTMSGHGGYGGGTGGMILLQASTIRLATTAMIFADGGGGGGGASMNDDGSPGADPSVPGVGAVGGAAAKSGDPGAGGPGSPATQRDGSKGNGDPNGGGGGGGAEGLIWIDTHTAIGRAMSSPPPVDVSR